MRNKIVDAAEAVAIIRSGDTVASSGFVGVGTPDEIIKALERRFVQTGEPRDLSLVFAAAPGDGADRGLNRLAHPGLIKRLVGGHFGLVPKLARMAVDNHVEAYNLPLGCVSHLFREIAGRKAGLLSKVGLGTFVDPANGGGKLNARTTEELVRLIEIDGEQWLFYKAFPINVAIIRGTTADHNGNISMEKEALTLDNLALATAAKNCKGFVIAQVAFRLKRGAAPTVTYPDVVRHLAQQTIQSPTVKDVRDAVLEIRRAKGMVLNAEDSDTRSVGSFFMNPVVDRTLLDRLAAAPHYLMDNDSVKIPAAWLIQQSGFACGHVDGAVGLSTKHPLAIINRGGASARDILRLARRIKLTVRERFDINLRPEPVFVGFSPDDDDVAFLTS